MNYGFEIIRRLAAVAVLAAAAPLQAQLTILSANVNVGPGSAADFASFGIEGSQSEPVLIRGAGPALSLFGVTGVVSDPIVDLIDASGNIVATNDNWGAPAANAQAVASLAAAVGAFSFGSTSSLDAALVFDSGPGGYTARVGGANNASGTGSIELYSGSSPQGFVYLGLRGHPRAGTSVVTVGFYVAGTAARNILVRGLGPALGVAGAMTYPQLTVFGPNGALVASNSGWGTALTSPDVATATANCGLEPLPDDSADAAVVLNLAPGLYTANLTGDGLGMVEVGDSSLSRASVAAPAIVSQPIATTANLGAAATLAVVCTGKPAPAVQWKLNGTDLPGATNAVLALTNVQPANAGSYVAVATNSAGSAVSLPATLIVNGPPVIAQQPSGERANVGTAVTFSVALAPNPPATTYQWYRDGNAVAGATQASFTIDSIQMSDAGIYTVKATNVYGSLTSSGAALIVTLPPTILSQPVSQSVAAGATLNLSVSGKGQGPMSYQWFFNGAPLAQATGSTLTVANVQPSHAGAYTARVTDANGSVTSDGAVVAVQTAASPTIAAQPVSEQIASGSTFVLSVQGPAAAAGVSYQWYLNGAPVTAAVSPTLVVASAGAASAGSYTCLLSAAGGSSLSNAAVVSVISTANPGRLINESVLATIPTGQTLTVGFYVGGNGTSGSQPLLVRGAGPALAPFGLSPLIADPKLTLYRSDGTTAAVNDNWGSTSANLQSVTTADAATGAFAFTDAASTDAAFVTSVPGNSGTGYSVELSTNGQPGGYGIAEIYDATPAGTYSPTLPRLVNLSALFHVASGASLTAGFVVGGNTAKTFLIRADGPSLAGFGVPQCMPDPQLALTRTSGGLQPLSVTAAWGGDQQIAAVASQVGAFALQSASSQDSALLVTLPPGNYSAMASSISGVAGTVLVEIFEVP